MSRYFPGCCSALFIGEEAWENLYYLFSAAHYISLSAAYSSFLQADIETFTGLFAVYLFQGSTSEGT